MDFQVLFDKSKSSFDEFLQKLKPEEKSEILKWLTGAEAIRSDTTLIDGQKRSKISDLNTNQIILKFFKALLDQIAEKSSISKLLVESAAGGGVALLAARYVKPVSVALVGVQLALPYILTADKFGELLNYLKTRLETESVKNDPTLASDF